MGFLVTLGVRAVLLIVAFVAWFEPGRLYAEDCNIDPFPPIAQASQGPYAMSMAVMPSNPTIGDVRLLVRVCDPATGQPVEHLDVAVYPKSPSGTRGPAIMLMSRFGEANDYGTEVFVKTPGIWTYDVELSGAAGKANFEVPVEFRDLPQRGAGVPILLFLTASAAIIGGGVYLSVKARGG